MTIEQYLHNIAREYKRGIATEHTYRGDLKQLIESLVPDIAATNEPKRIKCGAPDYVLTKADVPIGFIEAKDIGDKDLDGAKKTGNKEQFDRYKSSLNNLIFTDYLDFRLYIDGQFKTSVAIGEISGGNIVALSANFPAFTNLIKDFVSRVGQTITSSKKLAEMMAGKARILSDVIEKSLMSDEDNDENSTLKAQMEAFKTILIHDITAKEFADVYAQTIAYGMFAARLHDKSLDTFTRQEAAELIPKSNPFLRKLFGYIAGPEIDDRIKWIVDSLADIFRATDVDALLKNFGKATQTRDPMIHFYETFLSEYDPKLRKSRGVWYTPEPVVNFIVRAVDDILKTEFNLPQGLADTSKTTIKLKTQSKDKRFAEGVKEYEKEVHRVQILDPATGTGTFLAEVVKQIHAKFAGQQGIWSNYVENHLIPRLNGFELLMASYAMAHLKLDLLLSETGFRPPLTPPSKGGEPEVLNSPPVLGGVSEGRGGKRLQIYLTNSLEEHHPDTGTLWTTWLSDEANEANHIKRDTPVMCVIGNPPYSGESANKGKWIMDLMEDYKKEPGGKENLKERNPKWINDDYVKFLRYGQHFIERNGEGILAFINPHGFLDNPTFRGMRWNLLKTYDKIYTIDLHGNSKKKEVAPDGSADVNVFDIMQGVSINLFIKTGKKKVNELGKVFHYDLYGKREAKYNFLIENSIATILYEELPNVAPNYYFVKQDFSQKQNYEKGFFVSELLSVNNMGITSGDDNDYVAFSKDEFSQNLNYSLIQNISYRPFDNRLIVYDENLLARARSQFMQNMIKPNLAISLVRRSRSDKFISPFIVENLIDKCISSTLDNANIFPLYLYPTENKQTEMFASNSSIRTPNLDLEIVKQIADRLQLTFTNEKETTPSLRATPPETGGEFLEQRSPLKTEDEFLNQNSPPSKGGVREARGGFDSSGTRTIDKINNLPYLKTFRKNLRNNLTPAEASFWKIVQNKNFEGRKFRRQHSVGNYILDFYCPSERLAIELDGEVHFNDAAREYDYERKLFLEHYGIKVLRFENKLVFEELEWMLGVIKSNFGWNKKPPLTPPFEGGELEVSNSPPFEGGVGGGSETFAPIDVLDYIYAVLHSPAYREKYKEFLKIDFPRVPYPKDAAAFWQLVELGGELRRVHLLESPAVERYITQYPVDGDSVVGKIRFELQPPLAPPFEGGELKGKVWINDTQYFEGVPEIAWNFFIGGYQPAQKWLKDRKERPLSFDDIFHYQKIIVALTETDRLMNEIDVIGVC